MKTVFVSIALSFSSLFLSAQSETEITPSKDGTTITITVPVQGTEGTILVGLYQQSNFMQNPTLSAIGEIKDGKSIVTLNNVAPGEYGITLLHDKNDNKRMDFDANGMPLERFGVSNNTMSYGPPRWSDAKFEVANTPVAMEIRL